MKLKAENISIKYQRQGKSILKNQSVEIKSGKINVILGPNGCGKSTLFKSFAKQLKPYERKNHNQ